MQFPVLWSVFCAVSWLGGYIACSVKMAGYWPRSFFACLWTSTSSPSINTHKKELGQYPAILTSRLANNPYVFRDASDVEFEETNY